MEKLELQITNSDGTVIHEFATSQPFSLAAQNAQSASADQKKEFMSHVIEGIQEIRQSSDSFLTQMMNDRKAEDQVLND